MALLDDILPMQLVIYCQLVPMYHAIEALPRELMDASLMLKHKVLAKNQAGNVTNCLTNEPRFFELLSEIEWREKGLHLADVAPVSCLPNDPEFLAALPIANSFLCALTWEVMDDGAPVFCIVGWDRVWYKFIIFFHCSGILLSVILDRTLYTPCCLPLQIRSL
jgi:hypothetical protein